MKEDLLKQIAERGYAVSYAACLNYSTYDIIRSVPAIVTCLSLFVGILGLVWNAFTAKWISAGELMRFSRDSMTNLKLIASHNV